MINGTKAQARKSSCRGARSGYWVSRSLCGRPEERRAGAERIIGRCGAARGTRIGPDSRSASVMPIVAMVFSVAARAARREDGGGRIDRVCRARDDGLAHVAEIERVRKRSRDFLEQSQSDRCGPSGEFALSKGRDVDIRMITAKGSPPGNRFGSRTRRSIVPRRDPRSSPNSRRSIPPLLYWKTRFTRAATVRARVVGMTSRIDLPIASFGRIGASIRTRDSSR